MKGPVIIPDYDNYKVLIYDPELRGYVEYDTREERYVFLALRNATHPHIYEAIRLRNVITDETLKRGQNIGFVRKVKRILKIGERN